MPHRTAGVGGCLRVSILSLLFWVCIVLAQTPARPAAAQHISDWMVMQVCSDGAGAILPGVVPIDPACTKHRKIGQNETPPYRLRGWPAVDGCHGGIVTKWNMPIAKAGVIRIVSVSEQTMEGCEDDATAEDDWFKGASIQWFDGGYAFIMGSWSPVGLSSFESPLCQQGAASSHRFFRGWVIAPTVVPQAGIPGWGVFPSKLLVGKGTPVAGPCPTHYQRGLTMWVMDDVQFRGPKLRAIVSHHFARADTSGIAPGAAEQVERTYWTREFGLTRWEKWARDDWTNPRSHQPAIVLAKQMFAHGRCSKPYGLPARVTPGLVTEPLLTDGTYSQAFIDPRIGQRHVWYMTLCDDWTNFLRTPPAPGVNRSAGIDPVYWRE